MDKNGQKVQSNLRAITEGEEEYNIENKEEVEEKEDTQADNKKNEEVIAVHKPSYSKTYCRTSIKTTRFDYLWEINCFSTFSKSMRDLYSVRFPSSGNYQVMMKANSYQKIEFHLLTKTLSKGMYHLFKVYPITEEKVLCKSYVGDLKTKKLCEISESYFHSLPQDRQTYVVF
ncbi:hypothetical protein DMN91_005856 [Ooceraea biroi]|uniref:Uncharacterized protein n=1 Tax=Ooceraea biroi TaxID=2015173 RepID=A0A026W200_OOCBI|nr:uncharacterized protein LOC105284139 [Ooceraea biroi]XP_011345733.1 uncharacterized protein LOC105284139 [Ooceraea biroi]EZA50063.1 hypothetical protein X777_11728 [Ooceraea biroi]RLU21483.1 hypothetical protein DMN91_005856 [Ooceraea biroi]